ncbi:hypothetical protein [Desulfosporosinus sp. BICA1-9]|uniref:hypothetical protein n=1 Tax=Desulfosporosinus sp. BICA1-9 TaxID=1531958 RepID=UPI00054B1178|nr:hypothetical protein [Desulfosporosinus sp. BICA1-9]KJS48871.1 MAG: hypothetical protein VR66_11615 [Peptococcaceae bacterium BRH_c23]KJS85780.1 MAG: hypothetical protein JL57_18150 [Desulfosporosinus sp. BICA1-9]HBW34280.1 hypothetical protein [Desulfosporosinus sp.]
MAVKAHRIYAEEWNPSEEQINRIFPIEDLKSEIGRDPGIKVLRDDEIRLEYPSQYNISVQARAHNLSLVQLLQEYYTTYRDSPELAGLLGIQIPQIMWVDTLGYDEKIISLHVSKINKQEVFINDIVLVKNEDFDLLSDTVMDTILNNLRVFAKEQGAKYLSGYAANYTTLNLLKSKGFKDDKRENMGNDYLFRIAAIGGEQWPFYDELI